MKAYKGFDKDLKCRGFQYEIGKEYKEDDAKLCESGFHACLNPLDVWSYYPPAESRFCEVELDNAVEEKGDDSKVCGKSIKVGAEIGIKEIVDAFVKFTFEKIDWVDAKTTNTGDQSASTNTGHYSVATNTGDRSAATNTGYQSASTNTGYRSASTNTGNRSAATNTGYRSAATVEGKESVAIATGTESKASGALGCYIVLAEWEDVGEWHIKDMKLAKVDGKKIKANTFYQLVNGEFAEVKQ